MATAAVARKKKKKKKKKHQEEASDKVFNRQGAAEYVGVLPGTLAQLHWNGAQEIPLLKIGGKVLYKKSDLDAWLASRVETRSGQCKARDKK